MSVNASFYRYKVWQNRVVSICWWHALQHFHCRQAEWRHFIPRDLSLPAVRILLTGARQHFVEIECRAELSCTSCRIGLSRVVVMNLARQKTFRPEKGKKDFSLAVVDHWLALKMPAWARNLLCPMPVEVSRFVFSKRLPTVGIAGFWDLTHRLVFLRTGRVRNWICFRTQILCEVVLCWAR